MAISTARAGITTIDRLLQRRLLMNDTSCLLRVDDLSVVYAQRPALQGVSFFLSPGHTLGITGPSGSGKSSLALALTGLLPHPATVSGRIRLNGRELHTDAQWKSVRGRETGIVFQDPQSALHPALRCGDQLVETIRRHTPCTPAAAREKAIEWLVRVQIDDPERIFNAYPHQLSGGQQQRVMIALALCPGPSLLIADEPVTALDAVVQKSVLDLLKDLQKALNLAIIFISHDISAVRYMTSDIRTVTAGRLEPVSPAPPLSEAWKAPSQADKPPFFQSAPLSVRYPDRSRSGKWVEALKAVSVSLYEGETLGVTGSSGSGKSTLARALFDSMGGARNKVALIAQHPASALQPRMKVGPALAETFKVHFPALGRDTVKEKVMKLLAATGLGAEVYDRFPHQLSGGQKQRISIARALVIQPKVLICDEIVSALDADTQQEILRLLEQLTIRLQLTMVFITHDLDVAARLCQRIMVLQNGTVAEYGRTEEVFSRPQSAGTKALLAARLS